MQKITTIAKKLGLEKENLSLRGDYIAKVDNCRGDKRGKLVLVTAMTSNKYGIGKTTISIGLADALNKIGVNTALALREPSLGPIFGIKGGATGGGKSCVIPEDEINLHFTGDFHAVAQANNLLASIIDNHIFQGNELDIDIKNIFFKRCLDVNDRSLRKIQYTIGNETVETGFVITAASEVMAVICLSENMAQLKKNLGEILVALNRKGEPIFAKDLHAEEAMAILLKDAICPNLVQTLEGTPAFVHFGPFANIAHGCNSVLATKLALSYADYVVTEAGFGSDLGAEKFLDIKTRVLNQTPNIVVLVVSLKVVKEHGNGDLIEGFKNVEKHIKNLTKVFNLPCVVSINKFAEDSEEEIEKVQKLCKKIKVESYICEAYSEGGNGCELLAKAVVKGCEKSKKLKYCYDMKDSIKTKIEKLAKKIYGAGRVLYSEEAERKLTLASRLGFEKFFVNIAKTQFSFSDDAKKLGAPKGFDFNITDIEIRSGAKMIVAIAGDMLLMPGLGKHSNYMDMSIDENNVISGIF